MPRLVVIALLGLVVAGCGFQLRGSGAQAQIDAPVHIEQNHADNSVRRRITQQLAIYNVPAVERLSQAEYRFAVNRIERSNTVLALDNEARTAEQRLLIIAELALYDREGALLHERLVQEQRTLFSDPDNPVGAASEYQLINTELEDAIARNIVLQLARWLEKSDATAQRPTQ